ncbi:phosphatidylinositol-specific phospholipase C domain-containing protein [Flavobacterium piscisymbiosum]|uniref:1-phosphatidylinositol phosphodiesterase n=1 Tax=Flavobacterium piscisymbiosum TaxID=2893753 RepID=A0ABS8MK78_9FLAO|nr:phosphatidylinositol-specific phospholipase C domain-containing protein [Flavobacterium sp. F-30]MCC9065763.1 phosphatidylinositol-specific phospholipase C domain-containing protein [Flavobacterium sp. F-30]
MKTTENLNQAALVKSWPNEFEITLSEDIENLQIKINDYQISKGQPWNSNLIIKKSSSKHWKISVEAGRHKTKEVANWFKSKITGGAALGCDTTTALPNELNFSFSCTLSFVLNGLPVLFSNIIIAQGNNGSNNWWIGGANLQERNNGNFLFSDNKRIKLNIHCFNVNGFNFKVSLGDWMHSLSPDSTITNLSIPGTHDTGTYHLSSADFGARCQNYDIFQQLEDGIRFLDIRLKNNDANASDPLQLYHSIYNCKVSFGEIMKSCIDFLAQHPSEVILMSVENEKSGQKISNNFIKYLQKYPNSYYKGDIFPVLEQLRGKILFLYRFTYEPVAGFENDKVGIMFGRPWKDNATFESANAKGQKFQIEDNYKAHDTHKKADLVEKNLKLAANTAHNNSNPLFLTFNTIGMGGHTPYQYAWGGLGVNPKMNPWLMKYTSYSGKRSLGIIPLDFYNNGGNDNAIENGLLINIVNSNF